MNDLAGLFLLFAPDNPLFEALLSEKFSLGYPKNNDYALNLDDMRTMIEWEGKQNLGNRTIHDCLAVESWYNMDNPFDKGGCVR